MQAIMETLFDIFYLFSVTFLGFQMIRQGREQKLFRLFGVMAVVLGIGDAFHLIPRAYALSTTGLAHHATALGMGKLITSITMTIFYIILYEIWRIRYQIHECKTLSTAIYLLAIIRIILCLLPQNQWLSASPPLSYAILRNIPFSIIGILMIVLFYQKSYKQQDTEFKNMWLAITLSFAFYIPVVLFSDTFPLIGALMIPKTLAYVWIIQMGYQAMRIPCIQSKTL